MIGHITLQVRPSKDVISLHEPVFVDCLFSNESAMAIQIDLGPGRIEAFRITVEALASLSIGELRRTCPGFASSGAIEIAPRARHRERLLLQAWYPFAAPGRYSVTVGVLQEGARIDGEPFIIKILQRDSERLHEVCEALTVRAVSGGVTAEGVEAAHALAHVADPIAIAFLERLLLGNSVLRQQAIEGLGRVDDEAARDLLRRLSADRNPETAALARQALSAASSSGR